MLANDSSLMLFLVISQKAGSFILSTAQQTITWLAQLARYRTAEVKVLGRHPVWIIKQDLKQ